MKCADASRRRIASARTPACCRKPRPSMVLSRDRMGRGRAGHIVPVLSVAPAASQPHRLNVHFTKETHSMKQVLTSKLLRKVLILAFLITSLLFVASSERTAKLVYAAPCCEQCDPDELNACLAGCTTFACRRNCINNSCEANCVTCGGGGGGGGEACPGGCPIGYFCAADNTCTPL